MSGCGNICTVARCDDLERQIDRLKTQVEKLVIELKGHINQPVPYAHDIIPNFNVVTQLNGQNLTTKVVLFGTPQESTVTLPKVEEPTVTVEVAAQDNYNHQIIVTVNDASDTATLTTHQPQINFDIKDLGDNQYAIALTYDQQPYGGILDLSTLVLKEIASDDIDFSIDVSYLLDLLTVAITINGVTKTGAVEIDAEIINRFDNSGGGNNNGDNDMACEGLADAMELNLAEILAAIAAVQAQVTQVKEVVTVEVEASVLSEFDCPEEDGGDEAENNAGQVKEYKLATLPAIHEQLQYINQNQLSIFERICESEGALAIPDWWQVRLGSNVPQIVCSFRKGGSSTYHSLSIPHPANTDKTTEELLPAYIKGNWQGMIICKDNSKFIINCNSKAEAERMCGIAAQLIHGDFLELPPRIYVGERKGQAVNVDPMIPAVIQYFESGQQNTIPTWRVRVANLK